MGKQSKVDKLVKRVEKLIKKLDKLPPDTLIGQPRRAPVKKKYEPSDMRPQQAEATKPRIWDPVKNKSVKA